MNPRTPKRDSGGQDVNRYPIATQGIFRTIQGEGALIGVQAPRRFEQKDVDMWARRIAA